jgi:hypothetical protein
VTHPTSEYSFLPLFPINPFFPAIPPIPPIVAFKFNSSNPPNNANAFAPALKGVIGRSSRYVSSSVKAPRVSEAFVGIFIGIGRAFGFRFGVREEMRAGLVLLFVPVLVVVVVVVVVASKSDPLLGGSKGEDIDLGVIILDEADSFPVAKGVMGGLNPGLTSSLP